MSVVDVDVNVGCFRLLMAEAVEADPDAVAIPRADLALWIAINEVMTGRGASA